MVEFWEDLVPWSSLGILLYLVRCKVLSREGVGDLDSLDLSWSRGCKGLWLLVSIGSLPRSLLLP